MADERVLQVQQWLNKTYGNDSRYNKITEDGKTGWSTIYTINRLAQYKLDSLLTLEQLSDTKNKL